MQLRFKAAKTFFIINAGEHISIVLTFPPKPTLSKREGKMRFILTTTTSGGIINKSTELTSQLYLQRNKLEVGANAK